MAISKLSSIVISVIGKDRIKEIETAKGAFNFESKIKNIEKELDTKGVSYIPETMQKMRDLFSSYVKDWEYGKIETELHYKVK